MQEKLNIDLQNLISLSPIDEDRILADDTMLLAAGSLHKNSGNVLAMVVEQVTLEYARELMSVRGSEAHDSIMDRIIGASMVFRKFTDYYAEMERRKVEKQKTAAE